MGEEAVRGGAAAARLAGRGVRRGPPGGPARPGVCQARVGPLRGHLPRLVRRPQGGRTLSGPGRPPAAWPGNGGVPVERLPSATPGRAPGRARRPMGPGLPGQLVRLAPWLPGCRGRGASAAGFWKSRPSPTRAVHAGRVGVRCPTRTLQRPRPTGFTRRRVGGIGRLARDRFDRLAALDASAPFLAGHGHKASASRSDAGAGQGVEGPARGGGEVLAGAGGHGPGGGRVRTSPLPTSHSASGH